MIAARRIRSPLGRFDREEFELHGKRWTLGQVVEAVRDAAWPRDLRLEALVNGELVDVRADADRAIHPGDDVTVAPSFGGLETSTIFLIANLTLAAGSLIYSLATAPGRVEPPISRGDEDSATYNFTGIGTQRGPGSPIAIGYGSMRVGQQFISSQTIRDPRGRWTDGETILVQVALGVGPWHSIGGLSLGVCGELDNLGGPRGAIPGRNLPAGLRLNDTEIQPDDPNVIAHVRAGHIGQSPMPNGLDDASTIYELTSYELKAQEPRIYTTSSDEIDRIVLEWIFPQGLYRSSNGQQQSYPVDFRVRFRKTGETAWGRDRPVRVDFGEPANGVVSWTQTYDLGEVSGWDVEFLRRTADDQRSNGGNFTVSTSILQTVTEQRVTRLAYPSLAILGLEIQGNERVEGSLRSATVPCDMRLIRRYASGQWSEREWANASDPTKITAKNASWIIADMLTLPHYGGGALGYQESDLDAQSFVDFANYCDELVPVGTSGSEPRHQCSIYFDSDVESLDDAILQIVAMSRAAYVRDGSLHYVAFDHVKDRALLLTSERVSDVRLVYRNPQGRPTAYVMQILDEDQDYDLVEVNVQDSDALVNVTSLDREGLHQERINLKGCTRRTQAVREANYRHRCNLYRDLEVSFSVTRYALPLRIFDRFALSLYVPRWYATIDGSGNVVDGGMPYQMRANADVSAANTVFPDRTVTIEAGKTYAVALQVSTDDVEIRNVTNVPVSGTLDVGPTTGIVFDGAAVTIDETAQLVLGETDEVVMDFIVTEKTYDPNEFKVTIRAEKYDERCYEAAADAAPLGADEALSEIADAAQLPAIDRRPPVASDVHGELTPDARHVRVQWTRPAEGRGQRFRVYSRKNGVEDAPWTFHAETADASALIPPTRLGDDLEVSVTSRQNSGAWAGPDSGSTAIVSGQEFPTTPPPDVTGVSARPASRGFVLSWSDVPSPELDYYEVRRGPQWFGSEIVDRVRANSVHIPDGRLFFHSDLVTRGENYMVRARLRNGLYSPHVVEGLVRAEAWDGFTFDAAGSTLDLILGAAGTPTGCTVDTSGALPVVRMDAGVYEATYELPFLEPTTSAQRWWSIAAGIAVTNEHTMEDLAQLELGELHAWTTAGRDPSRDRPGADDAIRMDSGLLVSDPTLTAVGRDGVLGFEVRAVTELRIYDHTAATWGPWQEWTADVVTARRVQGRVRLERATTKHGVALTYLQMCRAN